MPPPSRDSTQEGWVSEQSHYHNSFVSLFFPAWWWPINMQYSSLSFLSNQLEGEEKHSTKHSTFQKEDDADLSLTATWLQYNCCNQPELDCDPFLGLDPYAEDLQLGRDTVHKKKPVFLTIRNVGKLPKICMNKLFCWYIFCYLKFIMPINLRKNNN